MNNKQRRHDAIRRIIAQRPVGTQEELVVALRQQGYDVTQATASRDIAEMALQKARAAEGYVYQIPPSADTAIGRLARLTEEFVVSVDKSENLVVLKTTPGAAQTVAGGIDQAAVRGVLGSIAGDDTILVIAKNRRAADSVYERFAGVAQRESTL